MNSKDRYFTEQREIKRRANSLLRRAKKEEQERTDLVCVKTLNGEIYTTNPKKWESYNAQFQSLNENTFGEQKYIYVETSKQLDTWVDDNRNI